MSRSWNSVFTSFASSARTCVGLRIGRERITAACVERSGPARKVLWVKSQGLDDELFIGQVNDAKFRTLQRAIGECCRDIGMGFVPVQVSLPDPVGAYTVFELDSLPESKHAQLDLARWRFTKEQHFNESDIECSTQYLGEDHGKFLLAAAVVSREWIACVRQACDAARLFVPVIDLDSAHQFNQMDGRPSVGIVCMNSDSWALRISDDAGRLRFVRARWRNGSKGEGEYQAVAAEVERTIRAYARNGGGKSIANLHVVAAKAEREGLVQALNERVHSECQAYGFVENLDTNGISGVDLAGHALSAAICR